MRTLLTVLLLLSSALAHAQLYRWTDASGRTHVTDTPPPAGASNVQKRGTPGASAPAPAASGEPFVLQQLKKDAPVTLYTAPSCEACGDARKLLNARGVPFSEVSVNDEAGLEALKSAVGSNSVPSLIVGGSIYKGYQAAAYNRLLDTAGYPKTGVLPPRKQAEPSAAPGEKAEAPAAEPVRGPYSPKPPAPKKP